MNKVTCTLLIGSAMAIVLGASVFLRPRSPEKEPLSRRNEPGWRAPASTSPVERAKEAPTVPPDRVEESPAASSRKDAARASGGAAPKTAPEEGIFSDLVARRARRHAEQEYWEDLGMLMEERLTVNPDQHRHRVMALTTEYLGLDGAQAVSFEATAVQATLDIADAWKARNDEIVALPEGLSARERAEKERQIQERYQAAKEQSSHRVESLLGKNPRDDRFRQKLGEWIDAMR